MSESSDTQSTIALIEHCIKAGISEQTAWKELDQAFQILYQTCNSVLEFKELNDQFISLLGDQDFNQSLLGHAFCKPYGQGGDFAFIDRVYQEDLHVEPQYRDWDLFWQQSDAANAIRDRKEYFKKSVQLLSRRGESFSILYLGGGSGRDIYELFQVEKYSSLSIDYVEPNKEAIAFAKDLNKIYDPHIQFFHSHVFRFNPSKRYDLIWAAGVLDYLDEEHAVFLLTKFKNWMNSGGTAIMSSFCPQNPSRAYMELMMDWYIHHRSEQNLIQLAQWSGVDRSCLAIERDDTGVNIFLRILADK